MSKLIDQIKEGAERHGSIPFWSWNDKLEEEGLRRQIRQLKEIGVRGFFMHARGGLETEYMSEDWFRAVNVCIDEAKKLGLEAWAYDENGWPSGFGGGALLDDPKNFALHLEMRRQKEFPDDMTDVLSVCVEEDGKLRQVTEPCDAGEYLVTVKLREKSYVDTMDESVIAKFIESTHEVYRKKLDPEVFGTVMPGFFTDEPQYHRRGTPWSDSFSRTFKERFGYAPEGKLPLLFIEAEGYRAFRYDYYLLCHDSFINAFPKQIYNWCRENGVKLTGHAVEEWGFYGQMMCIGGVMPFYMYEDIPGIDYLCRDLNTAEGGKQLGSVCAQTGKKEAITESFACCGWDVTPRELKRIAELQYSGGVNLTCEHLYPYSERGQRKRDYPNHYSDHNTWYPYFSEFEKYFKHLGAALSTGEEIADTLVIHPIRSAYMYYKNGHKQELEPMQERFNAFLNRFSFDQIPYHFADEGMLAEIGGVQGNRIKVGQRTYDKVVLPYMENIDSATLDTLEKYLAAGGKLLVLGDAPCFVNGRKGNTECLVSNITYEELKAESGFTVMHNGGQVKLHAEYRDTGNGKLLFLANTSEREYRNVEITLKGWSGVSALDVMTLTEQSVRGKIDPDGSITVLYDFSDSASLVLTEDALPLLPFEKSEKKPEIVLGSFTLDTLPENMITLDRASVSENGEDFTEERPIERIRDNLLFERFKGDLTLKYRFRAECLPKKLLVSAEKTDYRSCTVNGIPFNFGEEYRFDRDFKVADITGAVKVGENEISLTYPYYQDSHVYDVLYGGCMESMRNCLNFNTDVEAIYLYGDFGVRSEGGFVAGEKNTLRSENDFVLTSRDHKIDFTNINASGYPYFAGELTASTNITWKKGDPTLLRLGGRFAVCRAAINGADLGVSLFGDTYELEPYLLEGENKLTLTLCFSNRNLMGPHHRTDPEPYAVFPKTFSFEKQWDGDACPDFTEQPAFVRYGIGF